MRTFVSRMGLPLAALLIALAPLAKLQAADVKPAVVISVASVDKVFSDIGYLTRTAGAPEVGGFVTLIGGQFAQGLDSKKSGGVYITFEGQKAVSIGFLPVKNLDLVLGNVRDQLGEPEDAGDGVLELATDRPQSVFLKHQGDWAFFSNEKESLKNLPEDPSKLLGELGTKYDVAAIVHAQNIPSQLRNMAISELKRGFEQRLESQVGDEQGREVAQTIGRNYLNSVTELIEGADDVTIGLNVDQESGRTYIDFAITAIEGSELAKQLAAAKGAKSKHSGFLLPDAAANLHIVSRISERDIEQSTTTLRAMRDETLKELGNDENLKTPQAKEQAREIVSTFFDVAEETIKDGLVNGGAVVVLEAKSLGFAAGGLVSDGKKVEAAFRKLVDLAKNEPNFPGVNFNAGSHGDFTFHVMNVPIPSKEEEARKVFGERLDVALGIAPKSVYVAFGKNNIALLKRVIDSSNASESPELPPFQLIVSLAPIMEFAASVDQNNPMLANLANAAKDVSKNDSISITATLIERGLKYRFEVEEGVLRIIGQATQQARQQNNF